MKYRAYHNYDRNPTVTITGYDHCAVAGYDGILSAIAEKLTKKKNILVAEMYPGTDQDTLQQALLRLKPALLVDTRSLLLPEQRFQETLFGDQGDDLVFGLMSHKPLNAAFAKEALAAARLSISEVSEGLVIVCGVGASLVTAGDALLYANISRWTIQLRYRSGMPNWGLSNGADPILAKYKKGFFVLWRMADRLKTQLFGAIDFMVDLNDAAQPKMVPGKAYAAALEQVSRQPFRTRPYFDQGVWGGQWIRHVFDIPANGENIAWGFDGVPEENGLGLRFGQITMEFPCIDLVLMYPRPLLGERVHARFGAEFPIRFDLLDTMEGGNLSLQVHPLTEYIQQAFGMHYTQDESYYILEADEEKSPYVCLGLKQPVQPDDMLEDLQRAQRGEQIFPAERYVNYIPVKKHDHLLIPAGTVHCSGANTVVLEISATPYIFTFKLWDWNRLGLDGLPRPVHLEHGQKNIQWDRDTDWVMDNLVHQTKELMREDGLLAERTGLHEREFIDTVRYTFSKPVVCALAGGVQMLNLVEGKEMVIDSPDNAFRPFTVHYGETVVMPAALEVYRMSPAGPSEKPVRVIVASIR